MSPALLAPLPVAIPLIAAAFAMLAKPVLPRRAGDVIGLLGAAAAAIVSVLLFDSSWHGAVIHWFGGWQPHNGVALGINFAIDPFSAGFATFASLLVTVSFMFAYDYFEQGGPPFHVLMLMFLAAMNGFVLTGDLFNLFVFFELMSVAAYVLTAFKIEDEEAIEGAINFAVTNSAGAFLVLLGIAMLYGKTGALNMAQIGQALSASSDHKLIVVAFALIVGGFFVKASIVPFHFWLDDAHAVAPTPLCVLFSGIMVQLGLYAVARVYWTVFSGALGAHEPGLRDALIAIGILTGIVGSVMCFNQRHLKRLLAFSTIGHSGLMLIALALFSGRGIAGFWVYVFGHGLTKGSLFLASGSFLQKFESVDLDELRGKGRDVPVASATFVIGGLALAGLPPFGLFLGKSLMEQAFDDAGLHWLAYVLVFISAVTGGAVLRAAGRIIGGWGPAEALGGQTPTKEKRETDRPSGRIPPWMFAAIALLVLGSLAIGIIAGVGAAAQRAGALFVDHSGYASFVLAHRPFIPPLVPATAPTVQSYGFGIGGALLAAGLAVTALWRERLPKILTGVMLAPLTGPAQRLRSLHSGIVTDYVAWLAVGAAALGGSLLLALR